MKPSRSLRGQELLCKLEGIMLWQELRRMHDVTDCFSWCAHCSAGGGALDRDGAWTSRAEHHHVQCSGQCLLEAQPVAKGGGALGPDGAGTSGEEHLHVLCSSQRL